MNVAAEYTGGGLSVVMGFLERTPRSFDTLVWDLHFDAALRFISVRRGQKKETHLMASLHQGLQIRRIQPGRILQSSAEFANKSAKFRIGWVQNFLPPQIFLNTGLHTSVYQEVHLTEHFRATLGASRIHRRVLDFRVVLQILPLYFSRAEHILGRFCSICWMSSQTYTRPISPTRSPNGNRQQIGAKHQNPLHFAQNTNCNKVHVLPEP
jgi:hypothetical protein